MTTNASGQHLSLLFKRLKIDVVLDIGANEGQFGSHLRRLNYTGEIHSFEPVTQTYQALINTAKNDQHWHTHHLALGDKAGIKNINVSQNSQYSSFHSASAISQDYLGSAIQHKNTESVSITTLDKFFRENSSLFKAKNIFLKMDTQGFDLAVITGAINSIQHITGILSEIAFSPLYNEAPDHIDAFKQYQALGFNVTGIYPTHQDKTTLNLLEVECYLVNQYVQELQEVP